jgi:hypothetical protein
MKSERVPNSGIAQSRRLPTPYPANPAPITPPAAAAGTNLSGSLPDSILTSAIAAIQHTSVGLVVVVSA